MPDVTPKTAVAVGVYLAAIVAANLLVAAFGPAIAPLNALVLIGLDLSLRDTLHSAWEGDQLALRMGALIFAGGAISYALNRDASQIAIASTVAFALASITDTFVYSRMGSVRQVRIEDFPYWRPRFTRLERMNGSNLASAAVDSVVFPAIAFGLPLLWPIVLSLFAAKVAGGFLWSLILAVPLRRRAA